MNLDVIATNSQQRPKIEVTVEGGSCGNFTIDEEVVSSDGCLCKPEYVFCEGNNWPPTFEWSNLPNNTKRL